MYCPVPPTKVVGSLHNNNDLYGTILDAIKSFVPEDPSLSADILARLSPLWACKTLEESSIQDFPSYWDSDNGPRHSHRLQDCALAGEFLYTNYALMIRTLPTRKPTHVGEALKQDVWRKAMEVELDSIE